VSLPLLECGVARRPRPGNAESGDRHLVEPTPSGVLVAVVDGLGHGREAGAVATLAVATLERFAHEPLDSLFERCHRSLEGTRGVVMSAARFDRLEGTMTWLGVGNVEGVLLRAARTAGPARERLLPSRGVVGGSSAALRAATVPVGRGDTLILATDGLDGGFADLAAPSDHPPQRLADRLLGLYGRAEDDALVLVARYAGPGE
jgi:phosphoserine phosphatase RsbX